jgi:hypothetical protein
MATRGPAPCADSCCEFAITQSRRGSVADPMSTQKGHDLAAMRGVSGTTRPWIARQLAVAFDAVVACAKASCRSALRWVRPGDKALGPLPALAPKLLTLLAISCAMVVAGCAQNPAQREFQADPIQAAAPVQGHSELPVLRIRRPDRALLVPQPAPDCALRGSDLKTTVDPDEWARLRLDFERQCYQHAEKIARDRLRLLQASSKCEIEPVRPSPANGPLAISPVATGRAHQRRHS